MPVGDLQQVVVHWRSRLAVEATLLGVQREDPLERAQPPHPVLRSGDAVLGELISDEPVPVTGIVDMDVEGGVDQAGIVPIPLTDRGLEPLVVPLGRKPQDPARHHDRHPDAGTGRSHLTDEREDYFPGRFAWDR